MTAFELCGYDSEAKFRVKGGRVIWESITYRDNCDKCYIARLVSKDEGGQNWYLGLNFKSRYIDPDTEVELVEPEKMKCPHCYDEMEELKTCNGDREGIRHDRYCKNCDKTFGVTKAQIYELR